MTSAEMWRHHWRDVILVFVAECLGVHCPVFRVWQNCHVNLSAERNETEIKLLQNSIQYKHILKPNKNTNMYYKQYNYADKIKKKYCGKLG